MPNLMPEYVACPVCGERFKNTGLLNHVNARHPNDLEAIRKVREMVAKMTNPRP